MSEPFEDFYELLGVRRDATVEDIKHNYQEICKFLSPSSHPEKTYHIEELEELKKQTESVKYAYEVLINPVSRQEYDEWCQRQKERKTQEIEKDMGIIKEDKRLRPIEPTRKRLYDPYPPMPRNNQPMPRKAEQPVMKPKKETFMESIKRQYKEVRQDEKRDSFHRRHSRWTEGYESSFAEKVNSVPKEILYYTGLGCTHVSLEGIYQIAKLRYINKDAFTKFLIRNRKLIAVATIAGVIAASGIGGKKEEEHFPYYPTTTTQVEQPVELPTETPTPAIFLNITEPRVVLTRKYTIQQGDTLSRLAQNANSSINELKQVNGYKDDKIYYGRKMVIPYTIDTQDLEYYTEVVKVENYSLEELAKLYETDVETLYLLNKEAIVNTGNNTYFVLSDSLVVPKFITKIELIEQKATKNHTN